MDILTVHYNTPEMMECMIRSLNRHTVCTIHVFDNSDEDPFVNTFPNVDVIDNTRGQIIDYDAFLGRYPDKRSTPRSNFGSVKHTLAVDKCFDLLPGGFILMDSDVLVKGDISAFWDESKAWVGEPRVETHQDQKRTKVRRLIPFLCYLNVPMLVAQGVRYFNEDWMWFLKRAYPNELYDTGAWLLKDCTEKGLPYKEIGIEPYIEHYGHGSHAFRNESLVDWIIEHNNLWR